MSGNAAAIYIKCKNADAMAGVCKRVDDLYHNSDYPTRTQTEEAFGKMFGEMLGDLKNAIYWIGGAVVFSLIFVAGNSMAMAMRERTTEVAVLKAIGFSKGLVLFLVLAESVLVAGVGGAIGALGCKALFRYRRHLPVHGRLPSLLHHSVECHVDWFGGVARDRLHQRVLPGDPRGQCVSHRRTQESDLGSSMIPIKYNLRNLRVRWKTTLLTTMATGLVVWSSCILFGMVEGLQYSLTISGDPLDLIVLRKGSSNEIGGGFSSDKADDLLEPAGYRAR